MILIRFHTNQNGFTLLEALVAMVLIATVGMVLFDWINSSLNSLRQVQAEQLRQQAIRNTLNFMKSVNPMKDPAGTAEMGDYQIHWNAHLVEPEKDGAGHPFGVSLFRLGLYDTQVKIHKNDKIIAEFALRQVGFRQEREFQINF